MFQIANSSNDHCLFDYSFGPGHYYPLLIFLGAHIVLMSFLHFVFSDAKKYWQKGGFLNLSFFHYLIGNGLANIYIHNWIRYTSGADLRGFGVPVEPPRGKIIKN